jgi:hypothetical protein
MASATRGPSRQGGSGREAGSVPGGYFAGLCLEKEKPMRVSIRTAACLLVIGLVGSIAWADCKIDNKDDKDYKVTYNNVGSSSATETTISHNTANNQTTSGDIEIKVEGVGSITAGNDDRVIIKDGKLTKEKQ